MLLLESLSAGGVCPTGIWLSSNDNVDQEWTGLILGADEKQACMINYMFSGKKDFVAFNH